MKINKILSALFAAVVIINAFTAAAAKESAFELISTAESGSLGGTVHRYRHIRTGAEVVYNENNSDRREFVLGFKTPPVDSKGANHVLEHALFCGSEKYPTKNIMHYIQNGTSSLILNGVTADDCTYYLIYTENETEYYNMIDVYMNGIFHPLFLTDENIFRQQGIRIEYADGTARYNGVVYNELRIKNLNTEENSVNFLSDKLYRAIYGDTTPSFSAGGELDGIKDLTYEDLLRVYNTYYIPSNSMTYLSGKQDIEKTLDILDEFFSENTAQAPDISFEDTRRIPAERVQEYNIDENTKTVDIGFMFSGVNAQADPKDRYANEILYDIIRQKMKDKGYSDMYTVGGNTGGVSALGLMISRVPIEEKDKVLADHAEVLADLSKNGIDEGEIDKYIDNDDRYFYQSSERVMLGLLYKNDPLAYTEVNEMREHYKEHREYFQELLKKYYTENPYAVTVISGNGAFAAEDGSVNVSSGELERIKRETEEFQRWNDAEDDPEVIAKIPFLTLDEVSYAPEKSEPEFEEADGIKFYFTEKDSGKEASVYFPFAESDIDCAHLMYEFWQYQADKQDLGFFVSVSPLGNAKNPDEINPHYCLWLSGEDKSMALKKAVSMLKSDGMWNADDLKEYILSAPKEISDSYYDPYFLSSALKNSALSAEGRFSVFIPANTIVKGSPHYLHFLRSLDLNDAKEIMSRMKAAAEKMLDEKPVVEYIGSNDGYNSFKNTVCELFRDAKEAQSAKLNLPIGYNSAATITKLADANHFMIAATYGDNEYSGKMAVLGKVLTTKYLYPTMRGKHGAYGCSIRFGEDGMTSAVTGLQDIDFALGLWEGMGDYLRNMDMTQRELNSFIVSAVQEYDEWDYKSSEYGAEFALRGKSAADCEKIRKEMLETTVEDLKGYADFVDALVSQKRVFAVLGKSAADSAKFDFAYYADAETFEITPRFKKNPHKYMLGKTDTEFAPDDYLTRAEAAAIISRLIADERKPEYKDIFTDVSPDERYYEDILSVAEKGLMTGYGDGTFLPNQNITRAELAAVLSKFIYGGASDCDITYSDINGGEWYTKAIVSMAGKGYMTGYEDNTIRPNQPVTRAETVKIIDKMSALPFSADREDSFADADGAH